MKAALSMAAFAAALLGSAASIAAPAHTVAISWLEELAHKLLPKSAHIATPKGLVTEGEGYSGKPQNFLVLGSDRRSSS